MMEISEHHCISPRGNAKSIPLKNSELADGAVIFDGRTYAAFHLRHGKSVMKF